MATLDRRVAELEAQRYEMRSASQMTDAELLAIAIGKPADSAEVSTALALLDAEFENYLANEVHQ